MAITDTRSRRYLSSRYIEYTADPGNRLNNTGNVGGYSTFPFQFGFVRYYDPTNTNYDSNGLTSEKLTEFLHQRYTSCTWYLASYNHTRENDNLARPSFCRSGVIVFSDVAGVSNDEDNNNFDAIFPNTECEPPPPSIQYNEGYTSITDGFVPYITATAGDSANRVSIVLYSRKPDRIKGHITII